MLRREKQDPKRDPRCSSRRGRLDEEIRHEGKIVRREKETTKKLKKKNENEMAERQTAR